MLLGFQGFDLVHKKCKLFLFLSKSFFYYINLLLKAMSLHFNHFLRDLYNSLQLMSNFLPDYLLAHFLFFSFFWLECPSRYLLQGDLCDLDYSTSFLSYPQPFWRLSVCWFKNLHVHQLTLIFVLFLFYTTNYFYVVVWSFKLSYFSSSVGCVFVCVIRVVFYLVVSVHFAISLYF